MQIPLHERLNVFCGVNGSGKSTILDAIAISLSWLANGVKTSNASGRPITEGSIHNESHFAKTILSGTFDGREFSIRLVKTRRGYTAEERTDLRIKEVIAEIRRGINRPPYIHLPLLAYYPINRPVLNVSLKPKMKDDSGVFEAYKDALTGTANFRSFFEWFRSSEDIENEQYREANDPHFRRVDEKHTRTLGVYYLHAHLHVVREAISDFMPGFDHLKVRRKPLQMEVEKNGKTFQIDQLSDGEKCLMAMVGDIARRLAIANPNDRASHEGAKPQLKGKKLLEGSGIILIDEIDLHLHPQWQQMILPQLMKTFPNFQFIVSTHSPNVLTHVHPESLFLLSTRNKELAVDRPRTSYGKSVERILLDNMGLQITRPKEVVKDLNTIYDCIEDREFDKARKKIESLRNKIGDDPELVRSSALLKRKELIGK